LRFKGILLRIGEILLELLTASGVVVSALTIIGFVGKLWWFFELFSHFRVQYLLSLTIISTLLLVGRKFRTSLAFGLCAAVNLVLILPYYLVPDRPRSDNMTVIRVVAINVNTANKRYDLIKQYILETAPDILLLTEVDEGWLEGIADIEDLYPYQKSQPQDDNFGIALYSKHPCQKCDILYFGNDRIPSVKGEFELGGKLFTVVGTHPLPPKNRVYSLSRNNQLDAIADYLAGVKSHKMLLGDLNVTPWSYEFTRVAGQAALHDSARGFGLQLTWPAYSYIFRLPIDHCLVSSDIRVMNRSVGRHVGSDHFPILIDFILVG
jgi:endonuclease/exonuclease/phosphatase (EEP) superfamily protein YafD